MAFATAFWLGIDKYLGLILNICTTNKFNGKFLIFLNEQENGRS